jgi:hypothetical protein
MGYAFFDVFSHVRVRVRVRAMRAHARQTWV